MPIEVIVSKCGPDFDEYVARTFGSWDIPSSGSTARNLTNLWRGRRLKIHLHGEWKEGRVRSWTQSVHDVEVDWASKWSLELELMKDAGENSNKKRKVGESDGETRVAAHGERNETMGQALKFHVNRMNVEGGGTLRSESGVSLSELISLEWLEPAVPVVNLNEGALTYSCPYCRAVQPVVAAHEEPSLERSAECPVCLETCECRVLQCGHAVCHVCWDSCRRSAIVSSIEMDELDVEDIEKERKERSRLFDVTEGKETRNEHLAAFFAIVHGASSGWEGLTRFYHAIMVESPWYLVVDRNLDPIYKELPLEGLRLLFRVVQDRQDEVVEFGELKMGLTNGQSLFHSVCSRIIRLIESFYLKENLLRFTAPWMKLGTYHEKRCLYRDCAFVRLQSLGVFHLTYGPLPEAMQRFEECLVLDADNEEAREGRERVLRETKEWMGTSGRLSPGC